MQPVVPMKYKRLFLVIPNTRSQNPLDFNDVVVFSFLVFRFKYFDKDRPGLTIRQIARGTGLDKVRTIPHACSHLINLGLAEPHKGGIVAKEPVGEAAGWFHWKRNRENWPWRDRMAKFLTLVPRSKSATTTPLTPRQNCVFWLINSWRVNNRRLTVAGLAKQLMISRRTVGRAISVLKKRGLLDEDCKPTCTAEQKQQFWVEAAEKKARSEPSKWTLAYGLGSIFPDDYKSVHYETLETRNADCDRIEEKMRKRQYSSRDMLAYWNGIIQGCEMKPYLFDWFMFMCFDTVFDVAERITTQNRATGNTVVKNSFGLLKLISGNVLDAMHTLLNDRGWEALRSWRPDLSSIELIRKKSARKSR